MHTLFGSKYIGELLYTLNRVMYKSFISSIVQLKNLGRIFMNLKLHVT